jgi:periplasmic divalent cation tolerance protein
MPAEAEYVHVHTVTESKSDALAPARSIIQAGIAASVQVTGPATTVTRWETALEEAQEWQLRITTAASLLPALEQHISRNQRHGTPEFMVTAIVDGSAAYLRWLSEQLAEVEASS